MFKNIYKIILEFTQKYKGIGITKTILETRINWEELPNIKIYFIVTVFKMILAKGWAQWNRRENLEIDLHKYAQLIFDRDVKAIQWRKDHLFNRWCWSNWASIGKYLS